MSSVAQRIQVHTMIPENVIPDTQEGRAAWLRLPMPESIQVPSPTGWGFMSSNTLRRVIVVFSGPDSYHILPAYIPITWDTRDVSTWSEGAQYWYEYNGYNFIGYIPHVRRIWEYHPKFYGPDDLDLLAADELALLLADKVRI